MTSEALAWGALGLLIGWELGAWLQHRLHRATLKKSERILDWCSNCGERIVAECHSAGIRCLAWDPAHGFDVSLAHQPHECSRKAPK